MRRLIIAIVTSYVTEGTSRCRSLSLPVMEHDAPHFIAVLNGNSLSMFLEKFQKLFADSFDAKMDSNFRATAHFGYFLITEIIQSMK